MSFLTWFSIRSLTCRRNILSSVHDLIEHIPHHDMVLCVKPVVRANDRFERMVCEVLSRVAIKSGCPRLEQRCIEVYSSRRDVVGRIVRDIERLSSLENRNEEGESLFICEIAPECRSVKGGKKRG